MGLRIVVSFGASLDWFLSCSEAALHCTVVSRVLGLLGLDLPTLLRAVVV